MSERGRIGDLLRAKRAVGPFAREELAAAARMFGWGESPRDEEEAAANERPLETAPRRTAAPAEPERTDGPAARRDPGLPGDSQPLELRYERHEAGPHAVPPWLHDVQPLPARTPGSVPAAAGASLFEPLRWRAVLSSALRTWRADGEPDVEATVERIARDGMLTELPHRPLAAVAPQVQLLLDLSAAMLPFAEDLQDLERRARLLVAEPALAILGFDSSPLRAVGHGARRTWLPYSDEHRPRARGLVLAASDLGIGFAPEGSAPAAPEEWLAFQDLVEEAGASLRVLVPYARHRWPSMLRRRLAALEWDLRTSAAMVMRLVRAHGRKVLR